MAIDGLRRDPGRWAGAAAVLAGIVLAFIVQVARPVGVPLYDGQPVIEPYRFLHPAGGQPGDPTTASADVALQGTVSTAFSASTTESPPQAQLVAQKGAFDVKQGTTTLHVTITPIEAPTVAPIGSIAGNVYRFAVTDASGAAVSIKACEGCISLVLRAPDGTGDARVQRFSGGARADVQTFHAGVVSMYAANPDVLGDYAIVTGGSGGGDAGLLFGVPFDQVIVAGGAAVILVLLFAAALLVRRREPAVVETPARTIPSKRRRSRPRSGQGPRRPDR